MVVLRCTVEGDGRANDLQHVLEVRSQFYTMLKLGPEAKAAATWLTIKDYLTHYPLVP